MTNKKDYKGRTMQLLAGLAVAGILTNGIIQREIRGDENLPGNVPSVDYNSQRYDSIEDPIEVPVSPEWVDTNGFDNLENKVNTNAPVRTNSTPINNGKTKVAYSPEEIDVSNRGLELIKKFEGYSSRPYNCAAGVPTIGYGNTSKANDLGRINKTEAEKLLREDVSHIEKALESYVSVNLKQNQFDALASLVYNIGTNNFANSTLLKRLNSGDYQGAAKEFDKWVYAGGKKLEGLQKRRSKEKNLFLYGSS